MKRTISFKKITIARLSYQEMKYIRGGMEQGDSIPTDLPTVKKTCLPTDDKNRCNPDTD